MSYKLSNQVSSIESMSECQEFKKMIVKIMMIHGLYFIVSF